MITMGIVIMPESERHLVAAMIILRFLQDDHRFGYRHERSWDGSVVLPSCVRKMALCAAAIPPRWKPFSDVPRVAGQAARRGSSSDFL